MTGLKSLNHFVDTRLGGDYSRLLELFESREVYEALKAAARTSDWYHFEPKTYDGRYLIETAVGFQVFDQERGSRTDVQSFGTLRNAAQAMFVPSRQGADGRGGLLEDRPAHRRHENDAGPMQFNSFTPDRSPPKNFFGIFGVAMLLFACWLIWQDRQLTTEGRRVVVTEIAVTAHSKAVLSVLGLNGVSWLSWHTARVGFATEAGHFVSGNVSMPHADVERLAKKEPIYIDYLPGKPHTLRFSDDSGTAWYMLLVPAMCFLLHFQSKRKQAKQAAQAASA